jgi:chorismate mutase-like protein
MTIDEARHAIDGIDRELLRLLNERADLVNVIGEIKQKQGLEIYAPEREEKLLRKLVELNAAQNGKLPEKSIRAIYREIMSAALAIEQPLRIAYLGAPGTRTHQVALNKFGHGVTYITHARTATLYAALTGQQADYAVMPDEFTADGTVQHTLDDLGETSLQVCAKINVATGSSTLRYLIVGRRSSPPTGDDSSLLSVKLPDRVGALQQLLEPFVKNGINVRQIENRPSAQAQPEVCFTLEVAGHPTDAALRATLAELAAAHTAVTLLGSYPATAWVEPLA